MKNRYLPHLLAATALALVSAEADDKDRDHADKPAKAAPNGGRVLHSVEPHLEFFVTDDRKVRITAIDDDYKPIDIGKVTVTVTGGSRANPTRMRFATDGRSLISDKAFPEGNDFPIVVQIKNSPEAKTVIEKFHLNLVDCPTCEYKEYACICDHDHDQDHEKKKK